MLTDAGNIGAKKCWCPYSDPALVMDFTVSSTIRLRGANTVRRSRMSGQVQNRRSEFQFALKRAKPFIDQNHRICVRLISKGSLEKGNFSSTLFWMLLEEMPGSEPQTSKETSFQCLRMSWREMDVLIGARGFSVYRKREQTMSIGRVISRSRNGKIPFVSSSNVKIIFGCCWLSRSSKREKGPLAKSQITRMSSMYLLKSNGATEHIEMARCSRSSIKIQAKTGDRRPPMGRPWHWRYKWPAQRK